MVTYPESWLESKADAPENCRACYSSHRANTDQCDSAEACPTWAESPRTTFVNNLMLYKGVKTIGGELETIMLDGMVWRSHPRSSGSSR